MRPILTALVVLLVTAPPAAASWRWPVRGEVITPFALGPDPFAAGQHRGIDIAAQAGARVGAPCAGRVRFAGRLPGESASRRGVTIACGSLVATVLELGVVWVVRGERVVAGKRIGTAAASHVQLGARRAGERHGYLDPRALLGEGAATGRPVLPSRAWRGPPPGVPRVDRLAPPRALAVVHSGAANDRIRVSWAALLGVIILAAVTPLCAEIHGRVGRTSDGRRVRPGTTVAR